MAIYKSNKKVVAVYKGSTPINKIYKGSTLVFQKSGGGGSTQSIEGTATGNFNMTVNGNSIPITPDADGKWFYDTDEKITSLNDFLFIQEAVTSVDLSNLDLTGISTNRMFQSSSNITSIKFNNTKSMKLVDVSNMFYNCGKLVSLDLSSFDTSNVTNANNLFAFCSKLVSLDLSLFNTNNLQNAHSLFQSCSSLTSLDLSNFDTSKLQDASNLFSGCSSLTSLDLSNFDTSKLQNASNLFASCSSLTSLDLSNFDMSKVPTDNCSYMFYNCNNLTHIKCKQAFKDWCITNQDTIKLPTAMREGGSGTWEIIDGGSTHLFEGTATGNFNLKINNSQTIPITPDASGKWFYDTDEQITSLKEAFNNAKAVTSVDLSNFDLTGISTISMFFGATEITSIKFNNTKSMKLTNVTKMFNYCSSLVSLDLSSFDTSNLKLARSLFEGCFSLETLDLSNFDMSNATMYIRMFNDCTSLSTIKCKQAFKDWCITHQDDIYLPDAMREGGSGTWEIVA